MSTHTRLTGIAQSFIDHSREMYPDATDDETVAFMYESIESDIIVRYPPTAKSIIAEAIIDSDWSDFTTSERFAALAEGFRGNGLHNLILGTISADQMPTAYAHMAAFLIEWKADELLSAD